MAGLGGGFDSSICVPVQYVTPSISGLSDQKKLQDNDAAGAGQSLANDDWPFFFVIHFSYNDADSGKPAFNLVGSK